MWCNTSVTMVRYTIERNMEKDIFFHVRKRDRRMRRKEEMTVKHTRTMALILTLMLLFSTMVSAAATDPALTIISPASETVVCSDSLLISVKITKPETIKVSVYEEKQVKGDQLVAVDVNNLQALQAASDAMTKTTAGGTKIQFVSQEVIPSETFTAAGTLSFYTKQINNVTPGLYKVKIETVDANGRVLYTTQNLVAVKGVVSEGEKSALFETNQSGISQFLQNLLKNIFS